MLASYAEGVKEADDSLKMLMDWAGPNMILDDGGFDGVKDRLQLA